MAMDHKQKLDFVLKMTKHALDSIPHMDQGGTMQSAIAANQANTAGTNNAAAPGQSGIAGGLNDVLGTNNNFQATGANVTPGTNSDQLSTAYNGVQNGLGQTNTLANNLADNVRLGVNNQNLNESLVAQRAQGLGPNPAQNQLNQNTGNNIAQAAALAASTRGAGANAGMVANNAANTAANTNQQAAGQSATLQAQQQIAAQNQLQGIASDQIGQYSDAAQLNNQAQQNEQNILQGANTASNNASVSMQQNINNTNAAVAAGNQNAAQNTIAGIGSAVSSVGSLFASGGTVYPPGFHEMAMIYHPQKYGKGGRVWQNSSPVQSSINGGPGANMPQGGQADYAKTAGAAAKFLKSDKAAGPADAPTGADGGPGVGGKQAVQSIKDMNPYAAAYGPPPVTADQLQMPQFGSTIKPGAPSLGVNTDLGPGMQNLPYVQAPDRIQGGSQTDPYTQGGSMGARSQMAGQVGMYADGGEAWTNDTPVSSPISGGAAVNLPAAPPPPDFSGGGGKGGGGGGGGGGLSSMIGLAALAARGGKIPGKPGVNHDAYSNDKVPALLTPGEVVIDINTLKDKGKLGQMARFVAANIERKKAGRAL